MRRNSKQLKNQRTGTISQDQHRRITATCGTLSLLTGTALGAGLMYVLDPEAGNRRRQALADAAHHGFDAAAETLGTAYEGATGALHSAWDTATEKASESASALPSPQSAMKAGRRFFNRAAGHAQDARESARESAGAWLSSARGMIPQRRRPTDLSAPSAAALGVAAVALGMGAMWLFDPSRGRARRTWIGQKATRFVNETGSFCRATGRHLRNKARGYSHEAGSYISEAPSSLRNSASTESLHPASATDSPSA